MSFKVPVPTMLPVFVGIRREVSNTGFNDSSPGVFNGLWDRGHPGRAAVLKAIPLTGI